MPELVGTCTIEDQALSEEGQHCSQCGCVTQDEFEYDPAYECGDCGNEFHRSEAPNEDHRCECGKFAALSDSGEHWQCPECLEWAEKPETKRVVLLDSGDYLEVLS